METSTAAATKATIAMMDAAAVMMVAATPVATVSVLTAVAVTTTTVGGPAQDESKFQMAPIPILSVLTCSTS